MFKRISLFFLSMAFFNSCTSSSTTDEPVITDTFNRTEMLTNISDNIIIPATKDFAAKITILKTAGNDFTSTPTQAKLVVFRTSWINAYKTWQQIEMFDIGKAEELQYKFYMNIYPLTVADVESNVSSGNYDLNNVNYQDAQGFPALDYLLFGLADSDAKIIEKYTTDTKATGYKKYVSDVLNQMNGLTQQIVLDWETYRNIFINSTSNTVTSAINKLVNDYVFYFEKGLRANKFGIPAGNFSTNPLPEKVEAFYNKNISKELALESLNAVTNFFKGIGYNSLNSGESFSTYLISLERTDLRERIVNQLNTAKTQINSLDANFYNQVITDNTKMTRSYDELQKIVILLKVDMLQAFNINVDYVDADGD
jgi:predicted lipoprotein